MTGPHWVFLRGLIREQRHWEDFPTRFQAAFPDARVHLLDLPGNGSLCDRPSPIRIDHMVDAARLQLQLRGVHGPINLLAISLGGMVAIEWMRRFPRQIERAVIINSSLRRMGSFSDRLRVDNYPAILRHLVLTFFPATTFVCQK